MPVLTELARQPGSLNLGCGRGVVNLYGGNKKGVFIFPSLELKLSIQFSYEYRPQTIDVLIVPVTLLTLKITDNFIFHFSLLNA